MKRSFALRAVAALFAFALIGAACSNSKDISTAGGEKTQSSSMDKDVESTSPAETVSLDEGAPALTATLTDLLDGHVYLAGIAVVEGVTNGLDYRSSRPRPQPLTRTRKISPRRSPLFTARLPASSSCRCGASTSASSSTTPRAGPPATRRRRRKPSPRSRTTRRTSAPSSTRRPGESFLPTLPPKLCRCTSTA